MRNVNGINVLSLFDGMSCGMIALERCGVKVGNYFASEIDKHAQIVSHDNYPSIIRLGDVTKVVAKNKIISGQSGIVYAEKGYIDLIIAGSPCQGFSFAGKLLNFDDPRSKLFFEFVRLLEEIRGYNPDVKFLLENVKMKQEHESIISEILGCEPVKINSALVCGQNRKRLYWTNISDVTQPDDKQIFLKDVLDNYDVGSEMEFVNYPLELAHASDIKGYEAPTLLTHTGGHAHVKIPTSDYYLSPEQVERGIHQASAKVWKSGNRMGKMDFPNNVNKKAKTLTVVATKGGRETNHVLDAKYYRVLTPVECERLQTIPENYTSSVSDHQRYKMLGNGWTVDVIAHIFKGLKP